MLEKSSVFMMVLLVAASLIGISGIHQPIEVVTQPDVLEPTDTNFHNEGFVRNVEVYASSDGKACVAFVYSEGSEVSEALLTRDENVCDLFSEVSIANRSLVFEGTKVDNSVLPPGFRETHPVRSGIDLYQVDYVAI